MTKLTETVRPARRSEPSPLWAPIAGGGDESLEAT